MVHFADRVAIVTGAATGIGYGISKRLAEQGAKIVMVDVNESMGEQSTSELAARGAEVSLVVGDVGSAETAQKALEEGNMSFGDFMGIQQEMALAVANAEQKHIGLQAQAKREKGLGEI